MSLRTQVLGMLLCGLAVAPVQAAETVEYIHTDALGSPVAITDVNRVVIERSEFEPYGTLVNRPVTDGPGYTGHVTDAATGLTYMQQRYYDPEIGRFLSADPVTADGSAGANFSRYWYANNNPYKFTDPDGRESACVSIGTMCGQGGASSPTQDAVAGAALDFTPIIGDLKGIVEAVLDPTATNISAAAVGVVPVIGDVTGKLIKNADSLVDAGKAVAKENRAENLAKGIPESQLGPSGKPKIHTVQTSSIKESKDAARNSVGRGGTAVKHQSPTKGGPHHHGVNSKGEKDRVHYEYPKSKK